MPRELVISFWEETSGNIEGWRGVFKFQPWRWDTEPIMSIEINERKTEFPVRTKAFLEERFGDVWKEVERMTLEQEVEYVEMKIGRPLEFPPGIDLRKPQPRNILLSCGCFLVNEKPRIRFRLLCKWLSALRLLVFKPKLN